MLQALHQQLSQVHPALVPIAGVLSLMLTAWVISRLSRGIILGLFQRWANKSPAQWDDFLIRRKVIKRTVQILPAIVTYLGAPWVPGLHATAIQIFQNVSVAYMALMAIMALSGALSVANDIYEARRNSQRRPIKGYIQISKIILYCLGAVLAISALLDKSPLILLSGIGALTAVVLLVFKDTLLSLVASIQLSSLDMLRVGDWIEMPHFNTDGEVIDIELHTVRVQNWDKTITTIPTHSMISDSFKNWRGMSESGGRRIKRSLLIDMASVRFLSSEEIKHFERFTLLRDYLDHKQAELTQYNQALAAPTDDDVNLRRLTNLGTVRAYLFNYLKHHPRIRKDMTLMVRQLSPQSNGVPIELYCFTNTTDWSEYESIQADLFDHFLAIASEFDLRVYQQPSGADLAQLKPMTNGISPNSSN
ncbi:MAG: mechanosensitive ion channel family protein [Pseudomonadales bacterium]